MEERWMKWRGERAEGRRGGRRGKLDLGGKKTDKDS